MYFFKILFISSLLFTTAASVFTASASDAKGCTVKDEWLNTTRYDHRVDYSNKIETDFFMLVYSNSPRFCDYMSRQNLLNKVRFQCGSSNDFGWVIHGLWGESRAAYISGKRNGHPRFCKGNLPPLDIDVMKPYLCMSPGTKLLQGEWEKHGACDFSSAKAYFDKTKALFERFAVPPKKLSAKQAIRWMKDNNPSLRNKRLDLSGREFGICFTTAFEVMSCPKKRRISKY